MSQREGYFRLACDLLRSRHGTIPHPYFTQGDFAMKESAYDRDLNNAVERQQEDCKHEDLIAFCPHGCGEGTYDSDTNVCSECKEPVCPTWNCAYCDEQIGEGFERPTVKEIVPCERTVPPHFRAAVLTDEGERCVECGGYRRIQHNEPDHPITAPTFTDCPKCSTPDLTHETTAQYAKRMMTT